jgi:hypothetical protein
MEDLFGEFEEASVVVASAVTLHQLDATIEILLALRAEHDTAKKATSEANARCEEQERVILGILSALGRTSYEAEGLARVTRCMQTTYKVPKEGGAKKELFDYIERKYGDEALLGMVGINHQTLNSWAKRELEDATVSKIPGLELPTSLEYIQVRRK